jgi:hypothetical protein
MVKFFILCLLVYFTFKYVIKFAFRRVTSVPHRQNDKQEIDITERSKVIKD